MHHKRLPYEKLAYYNLVLGFKNCSNPYQILFFHFQRLDVLVYSPHSKSRGWVIEVNIGTTNPQMPRQGDSGRDRKPKSAVKTTEQQQMAKRTKDTYTTKQQLQ